MFITSKNEDKFSLIYFDWDEGPWWAKNIRTESIGDIVEILQFHGPGRGVPWDMDSWHRFPLHRPGRPGSVSPDWDTDFLLEFCQELKSSSH